MATFGIKVTGYLLHEERLATVGDSVQLWVDDEKFITIPVNPILGTIRGVSSPITVYHPETGDPVEGREYTVEVDDDDLPDGALTLDEDDLTRIEAKGVRYESIFLVGSIGLNGVTPPPQADHIADPTGGATIDAESRAAIAEINLVLENLGATKTS